ncbi:MAG: chromate transporter [Ignavibacteria bacterium]|nr:chromate transporter [Ignavibacteria bacterium]
MFNDLINLFWSFLKVGSFSFGGAYSLIPLIENEVVQNHQWLSQDEFLKVLGMVEIFPGAISIKFATYTGYKVAGVAGVIVANLGNMAVPAIIITVAAYFYSHIEENKYFVKGFKGIKYVIIGIILAILIKYFNQSFNDWKSFIFVVLGFGLTYWFNIHPVIIIVGAALLALLII